MAVMKTPGVYIVEKNASPNSVVEIATAVPAFIGYTEKALSGSDSLLNKPWRITSMAEFHACFGKAPKPRFSITDDSAAKSGIRFQGKNYVLRRQDRYSVYYQMQLFYANGGGPCYVVSVGGYDDELDKERLEAGLVPLLKEQEPSLLVIPEAVCLPEAGDCYALQRAMLRHCGHDMQTRFAILDVYGGFNDRKDPSGDCVAAFRGGLAAEGLGYGAAYYPWLDTSVVPESEIDFTCLDAASLREILTGEVAGNSGPEERRKQVQAYVDQLGTQMDEAATATLHRVLSQSSPLYETFRQEIRRELNRLPVSAAMAGIYTLVDNTRGVWKAPANTSVTAAVSPAVTISHEEQEELNVPMNGKSVNAIRTFPGEGIRVWGARTLDGHSLDWRYINVRRTMIMLEGSIRNAVRAYVFEPNDANTWINIKSMLSDFLRGLWKRGALAGASPEDAYSVHVGLGDTMTPEDILEGILRVSVLVAVTRPAEFIEIAFLQQMQKS